MNVIYVDPIAEKVVESDKGLPAGWLVPTLDISSADACSTEPIPPGVVVACSSEASYKEALKRKLEK